MQLFLACTKDQGLLVIKYVPGHKNDADIFTKNVTSAVFNQHIPLYVGCDEYLKQAGASSGEVVSGLIFTQTWNGGSTRIFDSGQNRVF